MHNALQEFGIPAVGALLGLGLLALALHWRRRQRLIDDLPTSKTTGVFIGLVELKGTAEVEQPLQSYLADIPCVYYAWKIEEHWSKTVTETYRDDKGRSRTRTRTESGWKEVAGGSEQTVFYLQDDCGVIQVRPAGAKIESKSVFTESCGVTDPLYFGKGPASTISNSDHQRRFSEQAVPLHAALYLLGHTQVREDVVAPVVAQRAGANEFLISTRTEEQVRGGLGWAYGLTAVAGGLGVVGGWAVSYSVRDLPVGAHWPALVMAGSVYLLAWAVGWAWMTFNSLINLRQRVRQAWANVDVELKRRSDLIPNLVLAVAGLRDHEASVQTAVTQWRTQLQATAPGTAGPDPQACAPTLLVVAERYPELKANAAFRKLQDELIATEQRIALARSYFNDIATFYNTRRQQVPDCLLANLGGLQPAPLMSASEFERAPVTVTLAA